MDAVGPLGHALLQEHTPFNGIRVVVDTDKFTVADVASANGVPFTPACGYYELTKKENINKNKKLVAFHRDEGIYLTGESVRDLTGVGKETRKVAPADIDSEYVLFVNSTSSNRGLKKGTHLLIACEPADAQGASAGVIALIGGCEVDMSEIGGGGGDGDEGGGSGDDSVPTEDDEEEVEVPQPSPSPKKAKGKRARSESPTLDEEESAPPPAKRAKTNKSAKKIVASGKGKAIAVAVGGSRTEVDNSQAGEVAAGMQTGNYTLDKGEINWTEHESVLVGNLTEAGGSNLIASFDLDSTIIKTKSGRKFGKDEHDWVFMYPEVPGKIKELHKRGYKIVVFTNQGGAKTPDSSKAKTLGKKIKQVFTKIGVPVQVFMACAKDRYRKPTTGMWELLQDVGNFGIEIDMTHSFYCGDAAGRAAGWRSSAPKDFSASDRKFAININLPFFTPEVYFLGLPDVPYNLGFDPSVALHNPPEREYSPELPPVTSDEQEMIIMVGSPASGKSSFTRNYIVSAGYTHVNMDTLKTKAKCLKITKEAIAEGKSVVIDNTNPAAKTRAEYVAIANAAGVPVRCYVMQTSMEAAEHMNMYRELTGERGRVPGIAMRMFGSKFEQPDLSEGYTEIKRCYIVYSFPSAEAEELFCQFTT